MRYNISAIALLACCGLAVAQISKCAKSCIDDAAVSASCASGDDNACICVPATLSTIQASSNQCVVKACGADAALNADAALKTLCSSAVPSATDPGFTDTINPGAGSAGSYAPTPGTSSAITLTGTSSSAASPSSTVVSTTSSPITSSPHSSTTGTTSSGSGSSSGPSSTRSPSPSNNFAAQATAGIGGVFAAGMAILAAF